MAGDSPRVNPEPLSESVMALSRQRPSLSPLPARPTLPEEQISSVESVLYMGDLLENMRRMAQAQGHGVLAHLLELARTEARLVIRDGQ